MFKSLFAKDFSEKNLGKYLYFEKGDLKTKDKQNEKLGHRTFQHLGMRLYIDSRSKNLGTIRRSILKGMLDLGSAHHITLRDVKTLFEAQIVRILDRLMETNKTSFKIWKFSEIEIIEFREIAAKAFRKLDYKSIFKLRPLQGVMRGLLSNWFSKKEKNALEKLIGSKTNEKLCGSELYVEEKVKLQKQVWEALKKEGQGYEKFPLNKICAVFIDMPLYKKHGDYAFENEPGCTVASLKAYLWLLKNKRLMSTKEGYNEFHTLTVKGMIRAIGPLSRLYKVHSRLTKEKIFFEISTSKKDLEKNFLGTIRNKYRSEKNALYWHLEKYKHFDKFGLEDLAKRQDEWFTLEYLTCKERLFKNLNVIFSLWLSKNKEFKEYKKHFVFRLRLIKATEEQNNLLINYIFEGYRKALTEVKGFEKRLMLKLWLLRELCLAHPFMDANTRTGWHAFKALALLDKEIPRIMLKSPLLEILGPAAILQHAIDGMLRFRETCNLNDLVGAKKIAHLKLYLKKIQNFKWDYWHNLVRENMLYDRPDLSKPETFEEAKKYCPSKE